MSNEFLPSRDGFAFANSWPSAAVVNVNVPGLGTVGFGNASGGLCGGMVFAALDYFMCGQQIPAMTEPPLPGSTLYQYIASRLVMSLDIPVGVLKFYSWMAKAGNLQRLYLPEFLETVSRLQAGEAVPLGLVRAQSWNPSELARNHQVLACQEPQYKGTSVPKIRIYDPNYPGSDDIYIVVNNSRVEHSVDGEFRGFFQMHYVNVRPPENF